MQGREKTQQNGVNRSPAGKTRADMKEPGTTFKLRRVEITVLGPFVLGDYFGGIVMALPMGSFSTIIRGLAAASFFQSAPLP